MLSETLLYNTRSIYAEPTKLGFEDVEEIINLFKSESIDDEKIGDANQNQNPERKSGYGIESQDPLNCKIRSIRLQNVKPEITLNMINEKLKNLETTSKEIERKKEEIGQIVLDVNSQIDTQLEELKAKLEAKFKELSERANQILKEKLDMFDNMQNKVHLRMENMEKLKEVFIEAFQGNSKELDKYHSNLTKLQEKKSEIHHFIQALDPLDLRAAVTQCKVRSYLNTRTLREFINNIQLVEQEITNLTALEDFSDTFNERKSIGQTLAGKTAQMMNRSDFQYSPSSRAMKELEHQLDARSQHAQLVESLKRTERIDYTSSPTRKRSAERNIPSAGHFDIPSWITRRLNASFTPSQAGLNQQPRGRDPSYALFEARKKAVEYSLNLAPMSPSNEWRSYSTIKENIPHEISGGKVAATVNLSTISATISKNSQVGNTLESLRKQRETFLKASFRNWN